MIIDAHVHTGKSIFGHNLTAEKLLSLMKKCKVDRSVICPVKPYNYHFEPENDFIAKTVKEHPGKFIGFARVDPRQGKKAEKELERCIKKLKLKGLMVHPWEETCPITSPLYHPLMKKAEEYDIPVMIAGGHVRVSQPLQIGELASRFPNVKIIATSGGQINICGMSLYEAELMLKEHKNVYVETSGIYREDFIENMIRDLGSKRVIYGSNSPEMDMRFEILRATTAQVSEEEKKDILGNTIAGLLKL